jgi:hypothetical protein
VPEGSDHPDADYAWKTLILINDWIRVSDAKIGVTLAAAGAAGVMLFNLVKDWPTSLCWDAYIFPTVCGLAITASVIFSVFAIKPRTSPQNLIEADAAPSRPSPFFFGSIATNWKRDAYIEVLTSTISDPDTLVRHIALQIHVNADIAAKKFTWSNWSLRTTLVAIVCLGIVAMQVLLDPTR